jgi:hypothetical protein
MKRRVLISLGFIGIALIVFLLGSRRAKIPDATSPGDEPQKELPFAKRFQAEQSDSMFTTNALGDVLTDGRDPVFQKKVFPKFREFLAKLDHLDVNPFQGQIEPASCSKIQYMEIPNGMICKFLIGDGWTADYTENPAFSGITYFGQRGPDNPIRAISHANTNALRRLAQNAIAMPEQEAWRIANQVAKVFAIDPSKFEKPEMYEEGLFEYRLGIYGVQYRKKGSDPVNQMNYTRSFSLKATSPTTAVLVSYSHLEATLR